MREVFYYKDSAPVYGIGGDNVYVSPVGSKVIILDEDYLVKDICYEISKGDNERFFINMY